MAAQETAALQDPERSGKLYSYVVKVQLYDIEIRQQIRQQERPNYEKIRRGILQKQSLEELQRLVFKKRRRFM